MTKCRLQLKKALKWEPHVYSLSATHLTWEKGSVDLMDIVAVDAVVGMAPSKLLMGNSLSIELLSGKREKVLVLCASSESLRESFVRSLHHNLILLGKEESIVRTTPVELLPRLGRSSNMTGRASLRSSKRSVPKVKRTEKKPEASPAAPAPTMKPSEQRGTKAQVVDYDYTDFAKSNTDNLGPLDQEMESLQNVTLQSEEIDALGSLEQEMESLQNVTLQSEEIDALGSLEQEMESLQDMTLYDFGNSGTEILGSLELDMETMQNLTMESTTTGEMPMRPAIIDLDDEDTLELEFDEADDNDYADTVQMGY